MTDDRTQLNIKINAKIHWLASIFADEHGMTTAEFVEDILHRTLVRSAAIKYSELNLPAGFKYNEENRPVAIPEPLWNEGLWDEDEATRFFRVASERPNFLSRSQTKFWHNYHDETSRNGRKVGLKSFREYWKASIESLKKGQ
jgi:hypothetical protein